MWNRFVDDTWVTEQQSSKQEFMEHVNKIDPAIKFTVEGTQGNGAIPFLDIIITLQADGFLSITVYCKPTHTDQYLQWGSHHSLSAKYSVIGTLTHRAKTVCTDPELLQKELNTLRNAMGKCNYPSWAINKVQNKVLNNNQGEHGSNQHNTCTKNQQQVDSNQDTSTTNTRPTNTIGQVVIPYMQGTAESF